MPQPSRPTRCPRCHSRHPRVCNYVNEPDGTEGPHLHGVLPDGGIDCCPDPFHDPIPEQEDTMTEHSNSQRVRVAASQPNIHGTELTTALTALLAERDRYEEALRRIAEGDGRFGPADAREALRQLGGDPTGGTE
jgi:hypothetical protein